MDYLSSTRSLEITIISAENLRMGRRSVKRNAFVTLETAPSKPQSTRMDIEGGSYPSWNQNFEVSLPYNVKHVRIEVNCKVAGGIRTIGSVNIPVSDFLEDYVPPTCVHFLSYRLREHNGNPNGIVNLSIRVRGPQYIQQSAQSMFVQPVYKTSNVGTNYMQQTAPSMLQQPIYNTSNAWASAPSF